MTTPELRGAAAALEGALAYQEGHDPTANPHKADTIESKGWIAGYVKAEEEDWERFRL